MFKFHNKAVPLHKKWIAFSLWAHCQLTAIKLSSPSASETYTDICALAYSNSTNNIGPIRIRIHVEGRAIYTIHGFLRPGLHAFLPYQEWVISSPDQSAIDRGWHAIALSTCSGTLIFSFNTRSRQRSRILSDLIVKYKNTIYNWCFNDPACPHFSAARKTTDRQSVFPLWDNQNRSLINLWETTKTEWVFVGENMWEKMPCDGALY